MRLGLTGGIGSGKSTVGALLVEHGAVVIDYDQLAREAVEPGTPALIAIEGRFGAEVVTADGTLDRPALGRIVFADDGARADLEAITHPAIRDLALRHEARAPEGAVVVHDHPLLVEMGMAGSCDVVVVVDVPADVQVQRIVQNRDLTEDEARARIATQSPREGRLAAADEVVDNTGSTDELRHAVAALWERLNA